MEEYLGSFPVKIKDTEFRNYTKEDFAMYFIARYGQIDGSHHKQWVLDQVARILKGTKIELHERLWDNGESEIDVSTVDPPSKKYLAWVKEMIGDPNDEDNYYSYDEGIAP